jgi:hypothetical protein
MRGREILGPLTQFRKGENTMDSETTGALMKGIRTMKTFVCEHQAVAAGGGVIERVKGTRCTDTDRGGICNSCWARSWAEDMELKLRASAPYAPRP